jgi:hypothetical protein
MSNYLKILLITNNEFVIETYNNCSIELLSPFYRILSENVLAQIINKYTINDGINDINVIGEICFLDKSQYNNFKKLFNKEKIPFESIKILKINN